MFYEEFVLDTPELDIHKAEYVTDELKIYYYLQYFSDGIEDLIQTINHEWLHAVFDWATEGAENESERVNGERDHFIMKVLSYD